MSLMTWGEFKAQIAARGVTDNTRISAIDTYSPQVGERLLVQSTVDPVGNEILIIQTSDTPITGSAP